MRESIPSHATANVGLVDIVRAVGLVDIVRPLPSINVWSGVTVGLRSGTSVDVAQVGLVEITFVGPPAVLRVLHVVLSIEFVVGLLAACVDLLLLLVNLLLLLLVGLLIT